MSIGKSSIARAVNATATKNHTVANDNAVTKFSLDKIGLLSVADTPDDITEVKLSISKRGVLCPVIVAATPKGEMWLIDGYRRYYAAKELGISQLSALVVNAQNKSEANRIYAELAKTKLVITKTVIKEVVINENAAPDIHEEKFRVLHVKDRDLPVHLL